MIENVHERKSSRKKDKPYDSHLLSTCIINNAFNIVHFSISYNVLALVN